jgi:hypothetical protein
LKELKIEKVVYNENMPVESSAFIDNYLEKVMMEQLSILPVFRGKLVDLKKIEE